MVHCRYKFSFFFPLANLKLVCFGFRLRVGVATPCSLDLRFMPLRIFMGKKEAFFLCPSLFLLGHKRSGVVVRFVHFRFYENTLYFCILVGSQSVAKFAFF